MKPKKKTKSFALALRRRARAATLLIALLCLPLWGLGGQAWAQETLTVYDETSNSQLIPMSGYYFDLYAKSECVIPATELTAMKDGTITAITFYVKEIASSQKGNWNNTNQKVFLKEVSGTTLGSYSGMTDATVVFSGSLPIPTTSGGYTITFSQGYTYNGGNLLIGVYNEAKGNYNRVYWYGKDGLSSHVSIHGRSGSSLESCGIDEAQYFLPKTTFTYNPAPTAVDLGLPSGKKWADMNVGAGSETGYGTYYAWSSSDIATAQWGVNWRMPTLTEIEELKSYTDHEWATIGGVNGMKFMKKTDHSVYIFLPATGLNSSTEVGTIGYYWTSTEQSSPHAYFLYASSSSVITSYYRTKTDKLPVRPVQMFVGEGTEASPYLIASTTDWNNLSAAVNGGETYSGKFFKMTANVGTVATTVGTSASAFNGTFDGNGHTLDVNISNNNPDTRTAPFAWAGGSAVIKNLHVTGSLTNTARTSGIVGSCYATTQISSCRVSATISGSNHTSGISISGGQITNCLFDGKINGTASTAGFATYVADGTKITNCLFKPQSGSSIPSSQGCFYTSESGKTPTLTNCYYTSTAGGTAQGTDGSGMTAAQLVQNLGPSNWKEVGGNAIPKVHPNLSGLGTEASPYLIASTTDWNNLVSAVNAGETYSGNYFKMTANVGTVTTWMTGMFSGTFDGDGKTLTVGYSTSARYCAPFGTLGGTVKNLRVAGTVSTSAKNFGGIAAQVTSGKTATIQNCRVSATLTSTLSGDNSSGGFVGVVWSGGTLNMTGCAFTGSLQGSGATACGGFLGYKEGEGTCSMTDCLFAPASVTMSTSYAGTFSRPSAPTMTRCYYTKKFNEAQGIQARTIAAGDYVSTLSVTKGDATATYDVSGITVYSTGINFNDGSTTTFYGGSGQTVSLALTAETRDGYQFKQYAASQGTLSGQTTDAPTLTMPDANSTANDAVTISAEYDPLYNATFADGIDNNGWTISPSSATAGQIVTISYTGSRTITSVSAVKKPFGLSTFSFATPARGESSNLTFTGASDEKPVWFTGTVETHNTTGTVVYNHSAAGSYDYLSFNGIQFYTGGWAVPDALYITGGLGTEADPFVLSTTSSPAPDMELTVTSAGEKSWTITMPTSDVEIQVLMPYTVTLGDDNTKLTEASGGAGVTLPSRSVIGSYTFAGWSTANVTTETTTAPTIIATGEYHPTSDITLYPVYTRTESSVSEVVDVLNRALTGASGTTYSNWSGKIATSSAVYAGNSAGGNDAIQLRSDNSNSGIVTTTSGGKVKKVSISWNSNTNSARKVDVYGKNSAYSAATDLYSTSTQGTKLGTIQYSTSKVDLTIDGDYEYIGLRSNNGALYLSEVDITWSSGSFTTYYTSLPRVSLSETTDNSEMLTALNGKTCTVTLDRTLTAGIWNTFASPFAIEEEDMEAYFGENAKVRKLTGSSVSDNVLTINFAKADEIEAGKPYLVMPTVNVDFSADGKEFAGVNLNASATPTATTYVDFVPTLGKTEVTGNVDDILFLNTSNKLIHPSTLEDAYIKGFRGYFVLHEESALAKTRAYVMEFGDGETSGIVPLRVEADATQQTGTYDLQGRRIEGQPTQKGVYIVNGKKVVIK